MHKARGATRAPQAPWPVDIPTGDLVYLGNSYLYLSLSAYSSRTPAGYSIYIASSVAEASWDALVKHGARCVLPLPLPLFWERARLYCSAWTVLMCTADLL